MAFDPILLGPANPKFSVPPNYGTQDNLYMRDGGGALETIGATQSVNDMLMQSWRDVIELFPLIPDGSDASFGTLRAVGGFLVSAARGSDGVVVAPVTLAMLTM